MTTILGQSINLVRPRLIHSQRKLKKAWAPVYDESSTLTISGKVQLIRVRLKSGGIRSLTKGTHADVIEKFGISPEKVEATGWLLEDGTEIWR